MTSTEIIEGARGAGRVLLTEVESKQLLEEAGIPTTGARLARTRDEATAIAREVGFPVVLKVVSEDIPHKSDVGGVRLGLADAEAVAAAYDGIIAGARAARPDARLAGVSVQRQARPGTEVIIGMTKDPQFGPVLMFGLGGVLVEVLKDVAFRIVPLERRDAAAMVREIKGFPLLQGYRGAEPADLDALEEALLRVSRFVERHPQIDELDLNPVFASRDGVVAVDARVVLSSEERAQRNVAL